MWVSTEVRICPMKQSCLNELASAPAHLTRTSWDQRESVSTGRSLKSGKGAGGNPEALTQLRMEVQLLNCPSENVVPLLSPLLGH